MLDIIANVLLILGADKRSLVIPAWRFKILRYTFNHITGQIREKTKTS